LEEKGKINSYKDLEVYKKGYALSIDIYKATEGFPRSEQFGLVSQMRRAAVSIPSNIAEGYRRNHRNEYIRFLRISLGSIAELETQVSISTDLGLMEKEIGDKLTKETEILGRMMYRLIESLDK